MAIDLQCQTYAKSDLNKRLNASSAWTQTKISNTHKMQPMIKPDVKKNNKEHHCMELMHDV